ncbi:hypothetical protein LEN26_015484 [Aphanomyces euteiches]|nr:hypothetical protein LEN26_015484 [Aphanomyces euteiches]
MGDKTAFLTLEDLKVTFSLFCAVCGIGTLSMPKNYASAGYGWASAALVYMALVNTYATVCISKLMLVAPKRVRTFADLGEFCMGQFGRWVILITQMLTCILVPIVFLVIGGSIGVIMFPSAYGQTTWIILIAITLLPICLIPTLKEGALAAAAGALGTILANVIAFYLVLDNMIPASHGLSIPQPDVGFKQVASVFGSLALAYGAGLVIPSLQREHSEPTRMPRVIVFSMAIISVFFLAVSITGVSLLGCQVPGNILFLIAGTPTVFGFTANRGGVILANLFMLLHIIIAFGLLVYPAYYTLERLFLGLHKLDDTIFDSEESYESAETPRDQPRESQPKVEPVGEKHDVKSYQTPGMFPKVALLRIIVVAACTAISCVWKDRLSDLLDFTGASCLSLCTMILPMVFYLKVLWKNVSMAERVWCLVAILVCVFLAVYESIQSGKVLFRATPAASSGPTPWDSVKFSYCPAGSSYQRIVYTNASYHANYTRSANL